MYADIVINGEPQTVNVNDYLVDKILNNSKRAAKIATRKGMDVYRQIRMYVVAELQTLKVKANEDNISSFVAYVAHKGGLS
jgi:hypothetical protein